jgi:hypothetical protein
VREEAWSGGVGQKRRVDRHGQTVPPYGPGEADGHEDHDRQQGDDARGAAVHAPSRRGERRGGQQDRAEKPHRQRRPLDHCVGPPDSERSRRECVGHGCQQEVGHRDGAQAKPEQQELQPTVAPEAAVDQVAHEQGHDRVDGLEHHVDGWRLVREVE